MFGDSKDASITLFLGALQCFALATLLVATPKGSSLRYTPFPVMIWLTGRFTQIDLSPNYAMRVVVGNMVILNIQTARLLLIHPLDNDDLCNGLALHQNTFLVRVYKALELLLCGRAVGTPWQVKNIPSYPAYYPRQGMKMPSRASFLLRQLVIIIWQYLFLDLLHTLALQSTPGPSEPTRKTELHMLGIDWRKKGEQILGNNVGWFIVARLQIDFHSRLATIIVVLLGIYTPAAFRPFFGRIGDAYTLRNFWGTFWHQFYREPLTTFGCFLARDVFRLSRPSRVERYTNIFFVFFASGIMHLVIERFAGVQSYATMLFFCSFPLGIMIEDGVQEVWRRVQSGSERPPPLWRKAVGFIWVMLWLGFTSVWYFEPMLQIAKPPSVVPFGIQSQLPLPTLGMILLIGAAILKLVFEVEV